MAIIRDACSWPNNTVRAVRVKTDKSYQERAVQQLYQLELSCDVDRDGDCQTNWNLNRDNDKLNLEATEFRPKRNARAIAELKIIDIIQEGNQAPQVEWLKDIDNTTNNKHFHEHIFN